jgi:hypothetical protein
VALKQTAATAAHRSGALRGGVAPLGWVTEDRVFCRAGVREGAPSLLIRIRIVGILRSSHMRGNDGYHVEITAQQS